MSFVPYTPATVNLIPARGSDFQRTSPPLPHRAPPFDLSSLSLLSSPSQLLQILLASHGQQPLNWLLGPWFFQVFPEWSFSKPSDFVATPALETSWARPTVQDVISLAPAGWLSSLGGHFSCYTESLTPPCVSRTRPLPVQGTTTLSSQPALPES